MPIKAVLYDISWANINLFSAVVPSPKSSKKDDFDDSIDANNPDNFNGPDEIEVR